VLATSLALSGNIGIGAPVLATSFALSGRIGIGAPVLAKTGAAVRLAAKLRSPTALTNTINTKTTNISHLFMRTPRVWNYNSADSMWSCVVKGEMFRSCA
jgi:hypothetical protein